MVEITSFKNWEEPHGDAIRRPWNSLTQQKVVASLTMPHPSGLPVYVILSERAADKTN